jgi:A/G-specific adenine glycosylase
MINRSFVLSFPRHLRYKATMPRRDTSPGSVYSVSSGGESDFAPEPETTKKPAKRARLSGPGSSRTTAQAKKKAASKGDDEIDIEDVGTSISRPHTSSYHHTRDIAKLQSDLLEWFESVREKRGMPWRKRYDPSLTMAEKGQRAYEIWVSEVMLQQTQVNTVIDYWKRWIEKWPTIGDLAKADIEEVNAAWRMSWITVWP